MAVRRRWGLQAGTSKLKRLTSNRERLIEMPPFAEKMCPGKRTSLNIIIEKIKIHL
jgi:hypothetical protein